MWARDDRHGRARRAPGPDRGRHRRRDDLRRRPALVTPPPPFSARWTTRHAVERAENGEGVGGVTAILGIETSCDETAAAIVDDGHDIRSSVVSSQVDLHARFGGVVPEIASRAHAELVSGVVAEALVEAGTGFDDLDAVAACHGPGLAGALLVGVERGEGARAHARRALRRGEPPRGAPARGLARGPRRRAAARGADRLGRPHDGRDRRGGRAVPAARPDRGRRRRRGVRQGRPVPRARLPGRPGHRPARTARATRPPSRSRARCATTGYDFSFSGLKTAVINHVRRHPNVEVRDVAASFQEAVVDVLLGKLVAAADEAGARTLVIGGGVAANSRLRARLTEVGRGVRAPGPPPEDRALHRQRGDDRGDRLVAAAQRRPDLAGRRRLPVPAPPDPRCRPGLSCLPGGPVLP